jgi:hypothetical protein
MADERVLDPPRVATGGGGSTRRGRGNFGTEGAGGRSGTPAGDDFDHLAAMLERIGRTLKSLIFLEPPLLPEKLRPGFIEVWPETQRHLNLAVGRLRGDLPRRHDTRRRLEAAGLTGSMLQMKETSLYFYLNQIDEGVQAYSQSDRPILTYPQDEGLVRRLLFLLKPSFKVMNSIIGSIPAAVFPGKEIVKEVKEHVEAGYEAVELGRAEVNQ